MRPEAFPQESEQLAVYTLPKKNKTKNKKTKKSRVDLAYVGLPQLQFSLIADLGYFCTYKTPNTSLVSIVQ